jgi:pimeloyl-ACP methyl ester carboxylesterase/DNA-binding CsgD family transcriptional regulator
LFNKTTEQMQQHRQHIQFCTTPDGARIAVASLGNGPPLVRAAHWLSHVEYDLRSPVWRPWLTRLARDRTYVRYDPRGCGLSDRHRLEVGLNAWVADLETVVDHLGLDRFPLLGMSQGGAIAIQFAARHPERVSHLVLVGAYARGLLRRDPTPEGRIEAETLVNLVRLGWGRDNAAFRQVFTSQFIPDGTPEQHRWWNDLERVSASPDAAARILEAFHSIDVTNIAAELSVPTLVVHARGDARVPFEEGRLLASLIPSARFVALESNNHVLIEAESSWAPFFDEVRDFLWPGRTGARSSAALSELTASETVILELLARGLDNQEIAERLKKSEKTVRNQISSIFGKLGVRTRAQAIVLARNNGFGGADAS